MNATARPALHEIPQHVREESLVRVYVWQMPVRIAHWLIFLSIVVLSFTGYYLYDPFITSRGSGAFLMGTMRFIHEVTAWIFIAAVLLRFYWFFQGNRWAHWRSFLPLEKWWRKGLRRQLKYYLFLNPNPESEVGHNPLAAMTYAIVYALMGIQILTGLALYNHILGSKALGFFIDWLPALISIRYLSEIHFLIMFAFGAFVIHHVYSAVLIGIEERSGLVGGIFSGYKFFPAAFVASDPTRRPHEAKVPAVPAGPSQRLRTGIRPGQENAAAVSPPQSPKTGSSH
ncbi:MAG: Ni/Fe-hydrogenase, b-type cytochrome subunit [Candidatus Acidiferrales bacterium]